MTSARLATATLVDFSHGLADLSGATILPYFRRRVAVANKAAGSAFDPVTAADRAAERVIRKAILARFADHDVIGEEYGATERGGRYRWLLDPIDGTRAFIMGSPLWGTLIGLLEDGTPRLGLMDQPFTGERFWSDGRGAHWRGPGGKVRRIRTRSCARLADAILTTTHPELFQKGGEGERFASIRARVRMTRYGGDCYGYCLLASGCVDLIVEAGLKPYDVAALVPIIEAAGGIITTWDGNSAAGGGRIVAAGDRRVHEQAVAILGGGRA